MLLKCLIFKTSQNLKDSTQCGIQTWSGRCQLSLAMPEIRREGDVKITCAHAVLFGDGHQSIFIGIHVPIELGFLWWDGWLYLIYCLLTMARTGMDPLLCHYCLMGVWRWTCMNIHLGVSIIWGIPPWMVYFMEIPTKKGEPPRPPEPSPEPCWIWLGFAPKPPRPSPESSLEPCWTCPGTLLNLTWLCTKASQTFSGTFSGTLLNLTCLCTKVSQTFFGLLRNPVERDLALHRSLPDLPWNLRNLLRNFVERDPAPAPMHTWAFLGWKIHSIMLLGNDFMTKVMENYDQGDQLFGKLWFMTKVMVTYGPSDQLSPWNDLWPKWWKFMTKVISLP